MGNQEATTGERIAALAGVPLDVAMPAADALRDDHDAFLAGVREAVLVGDGYSDGTLVRPPDGYTDLNDLYRFDGDPDSKRAWVVAFLADAAGRYNLDLTPRVEK